MMRTAEAQEHFLYTTLNEIDQFDALYQALQTGAIGIRPGIATVIIRSF